MTADPQTTPKPVGERQFDVQINPATLRLQTTASVDSRKDAGRQRSQYQGTTSTLSFDLVFDTSDEGTTDVPVDVRDRTRQLERFVLAGREGDGPATGQFTYGTFTVVGRDEGLNTDLDLFSANGVPLRAKCAVRSRSRSRSSTRSRRAPGQHRRRRRPIRREPDTRALLARAPPAAHRAVRAHRRPHRDRARRRERVAFAEPDGAGPPGVEGAARASPTR